MNNPLLNPFQTAYNVPPFAEIRNEHFLPALEESLKEARGEINDILENEDEPTFSNTIEKLEKCGERLDTVSNLLFNLNSAETSDEIQQIAQEATPMLTKFDSEVKQNEQLFEKIRKLYDNRADLELSGEQLMLLEKTHKSFVRSGAGLGEDDKKVFQEILVELGQLGLTFGEHVLAETNNYELIVTDEKDLSGLPNDVISRAKALAEDRNKEGWMFTLQAPSYVPFMEYADNRNLRETLFRAYMSKAFKGDENDNRETIERIIQLRKRKAKLLGHDNYAEYILQDRMAENPSNVLDFLDDLLVKCKPLAENEKKELEEFIQELGVDHELQRWDWAYYSEKLRKKKYDIDDELVKPFFKLENVIYGVFKTAEELFGISFRENKEIPVYHEDVKAYEVLDEENKVSAVFMADFFPRAGKRPGAWMTSYRSQRKENGSRVIPIVSIVCNFTPSTGEKPSLLKFDEVRTLFHEFGHALHGMLADTEYASLSGTSVYWDFVELPSQIMENWCYEGECLDLFAKHYETSESIPSDYIQRLKDSATFHEAYATLRQLSFGLLDMAYHQDIDLTEKFDVNEFERSAMSATDLFPKVDGTNMSVQFAHIFAGGYAAGYYSYKWAEVLDADAFELFKEEGIFNKEIANSFRENILSKGGTEHPMTLYKRFRGKEPNSDALLRRAGLLN